VNCCTISALNTCLTRVRQTSRTMCFGSLRVARRRRAQLPCGDLVEPGFRAIADGGRFVEIGKRGIKSQAWVDALKRDIRYDIVDWERLLTTSHYSLDKCSSGLSLTSPADDDPLPRHEFTLDEAAKGFPPYGAGPPCGANSDWPSRQHSATSAARWNLHSASRRSHRLPAARIFRESLQACSVGAGDRSAQAACTSSARCGRRSSPQASRSRRDEVVPSRRTSRGVLA